MDEAKVVAGVIKSLRKIREQKGISVYRIALDTGLSPSGIRGMEAGKINPTLYFLLRVANYLEADLPALLASVRSGKLK